MFSRSFFAQTANVYVAPDHQSVQSGSNVIISVAIADVASLHSYSITIVYDSSLVEFNNISQLDFFSPYQSLFLYNLNAHNSNIIVDASILGTDNQSGSGELFQVEFLTKSDGSTEIIIDSVALRNSENNSIESTSVNGNITITPVTNITERENLNYKVELANYPNPFNNSTVIYFRTNNNSPIDLVIFNLLGQQVYIKSILTVNSGEHQFVWNGKNNFGEELSSGIYLLNVNQESVTASKKIIMLK